MDYKNIPACTYTQPEVASVGMSEKAAKDTSPCGLCLALSFLPSFIILLLLPVTLPASPVSKIPGIAVLHNKGMVDPELHGLGQGCVKRQMSSIRHAPA